MRTEFNSLRTHPYPGDAGSKRIKLNRRCGRPSSSSGGSGGTGSGQIGSVAVEPQRSARGRWPPTWVRADPLGLAAAVLRQSRPGANAVPIATATPSFQSWDQSRASINFGTDEAAAREGVLGSLAGLQSDVRLNVKHPRFAPPECLILNKTNVARTMNGKYVVQFAYFCFIVSVCS